MYIASRRRDTWWHRSPETTKVVRTVVLLSHASLRSARSEGERGRENLKCADIAGLNRYFVWARDTVYSKLRGDMRSDPSVPTTKSQLEYSGSQVPPSSLSPFLSLSRTHFNSSRISWNVQYRETPLATSNDEWFFWRKKVARWKLREEGILARQTRAQPAATRV